MALSMNIFNANRINSLTTVNLSLYYHVHHSWAVGEAPTLWLSTCCMKIEPIRVGSTTIKPADFSRIIEYPETPPA